jgi:hypothetical protein
VLMLRLVIIDQRMRHDFIDKGHRCLVSGVR